MEIKDLIENLEIQKNNLSELLSSASQKQQALIQSNYENLESSIMAEERSLVKIQQAEKQRLNIIKELYSQFSLNNGTPKLSEFIEKTKNILDRKSQEKITKTEQELKRLIKQISGINQQNRYLVENSRAFIKETIGSLINANKPFLDRKV